MSSVEVASVRARLLSIAAATGVGHAGSCLSCLDLIVHLVGKCLRPGMDRFILSKGHAALTLYATLAERDKTVESALRRYDTDGCRLGGHATLDRELGIDATTGSLGMGLGVAIGYALSDRLRGVTARTFVLIGDGELDEGMVWEGLRFAGDRRLCELVVIIDANGWRGYDRALRVTADHFWPLGFDVREFDGHDPAAIAAAFAGPFEVATALIARTVKGRGLLGMEDSLDSHYAKVTRDASHPRQSD